MSEMGFENVFYLENFECAGDEVLVESSPPASPDMAARLAAPAQNAGVSGGAGESSPSTVRELIVIPELPNSIHLQHAIQQVSSTVVEVNGDSSGHSSPNAEAQHTFITVAMQGAWRDTAQEIKVEDASDPESEGGNGVNYHVQYVTEPQEIYAQGHQNMDGIRTYPVYGVATVSGGAGGEGTGWGSGDGADYTAYPVVVAGDEPEPPASPPPATPAAAPRMPPATVQWLLDNYETAEGVSLPRSTLYAHYLRHCAHHRLDPVNAASFGKLIRSVFVGLRTRRLGTRGNSKYHYYGIRAKPSAAGQPEPADTAGAGGGGGGEGETPAVRAPGGAHRAYLGCLSPPSPPALRADEPGEAEAAAALVGAHRAHGAALLAAAVALEAPAVRAAMGWWRAAGPTAARLLATPHAARWLRRASATLYQRALDALLPDVLRPIPPQLTQAIRNFAKGVEAAVWGGCTDAETPAGARRAQAAAAGALAAALRRYTSLNHLAQAARAVLTNHHQIHQMVSDLNRVDFRVVREQASWAMACGGGGAARRLEADFKATLGRGATLEQWAAWLERAVRRALSRHARLAPARFVSRARRLLLDWSFYSSLVIRELTLRSAASFGSFHLIRLLYDEYVSYLIERRVAEHLDLPPIAVMHRLTEEDNENGDDNGDREDGEDDDHDHDHDHDHNHDQVDDHDQIDDHDQEQDNDNEQEWDWEDDDDDEDDEPDMKKMKSDSE